MKAALALALGCLAISATIAEDITVKINKGAVKGVRIDHDFGQYYYSFRGIRYAQAPVGKLRFKVILYQSINQYQVNNVVMIIAAR